MTSPLERTASTSKIPSSPGESRIPRPGFSTRKSGTLGAAYSGIPRLGLDKAWSGGSGSLLTARANGGAENNMEPDTSSDKVLVTVRLRPIRLTASATDLYFKYTSYLSESYSPSCFLVAGTVIETLAWQVRNLRLVFLQLSPCLLQ